MDQDREEALRTMPETAPLTTGQEQQRKRAERRAVTERRRERATKGAEAKIRAIALADQLGAVKLPPHNPRRKSEIHHRDRMITALSVALSKIDPNGIAPGSWRKWAHDVALGKGAK